MTLYTVNVCGNVINAVRVFALRGITWFEGRWIKTITRAFIYKLRKGLFFFLVYFSLKPTFQKKKGIKSHFLANYGNIKID